MNYTKNILDKVTLDINITNNPYNLELEDILEFGLRVNPKRNFLFISKILGKHLSCNPEAVKVTGGVLANIFAKKCNLNTQINEDKLINAIKSNNYEGVDTEYGKEITLKEKTLVIGFGETATGIAQATASFLKDSLYLHTTRENLLNGNRVFEFEEEHSHASSHICYINNEKDLEGIERVILIDDELTTGKTCLNLIKVIKSKYNVNNFTVLTLLDFRNRQWMKHCSKFTQTIGVNVDVLSLIKAEVVQNKGFDIKELVIKEENIKANREVEVINCYPNMMFTKTFDTEFGERDYSMANGRYGFKHNMFKYYDDTEKENLKEDIESLINKEKTLVLGFGEYIYFPSRIASYLDGDVSFKSFTRSPIYVCDTEGYPIKNKIEFIIDGVKYYLYNIDKDVKQAVIISDFEFNNVHIESIKNAFKTTNIEKIYLFTE